MSKRNDDVILCRYR